MYSLKENLNIKLVMNIKKCFFQKFVLIINLNKHVIFHKINYFGFYYQIQYWIMREKLKLVEDKI